MLLQWNDTWDLDAEACPCDVHFIDWIERKGLSDQKIFHMGTGAHHIVGFILAQSNKNHIIHAITAAPGEYKRGMELLIDVPSIGWHYKPMFGDIYQTDARQYSSLDVITLFHLCENTNQVRNSIFSLSYEETVRRFLFFLNPGGYLLGYKNSFRFDEANVIFSDLEREGLIKHEEDHLSLRVWSKSCG